MTAPAPVLERCEVDDDPYTHFYDCNDAIAWCGLDIEDLPEVPDGEEPECPACLLADEMGAYACCGGAS